MSLQSDKRKNTKEGQLDTGINKLDRKKQEISQPGIARKSSKAREQDGSIKNSK